MRISDWSSDVCSSDLPVDGRDIGHAGDVGDMGDVDVADIRAADAVGRVIGLVPAERHPADIAGQDADAGAAAEEDDQGRGIDRTRPAVAHVDMQAGTPGPAIMDQYPATILETPETTRHIGNQGEPKNGG